MRTSDLIAELERIASAAKMAVQGLNFSRAAWSYIPPHLTERFGAALLGHPVISQIEGKVYTLPNTGGVVSLRRDAVYLIQRVIEGIPAKTVVDSLVNISHDRAVSTSTIAAIEGVSLTSPVVISEHLSVEPADGLPPYHREIFTRANSPAHGFGSHPQSAVVYHEVHDRQFLTSELTDDIANFAVPPFEEALLTLLLISDGAPQYRQQYVVVNDAGWPGMSSPGFGEAQPFPQPVKPIREADWDQSSAIYNQLSTLNVQTKRSLMQAVRKLETSRRRSTLTERAVELGVCAEMLLMHGGNDKGEITNKVATRAAWMLGSDSTTRLSTFKLARDLYNDRSKVAHGGEIIPGPIANDFDAAEAKFGAYDRLCRELIKEIAKRGGWPDWTELVLNVER